MHVIRICRQLKVSQFEKNIDSFGISFHCGRTQLALVVIIHAEDNIFDIHGNEENVATIVAAWIIDTHD